LRACKGCTTEHRATLDALLSSGANGRQVIERMQELTGETWRYSNLQSHRPHVATPEQADELERLVRALESEASAAPPTVEALYRLLLRGVRAMAHSTKPPTAGEMVRLATSIKELTGMNYQQRMLAEYMRVRFSPEQETADREIAAQQRAEREARYGSAPLLDEEGT
jgi:hypothetical protein